MATNKKKGTSDSQRRGSRKSKSERKEGTGFETSQQVSGSSKSEGLESSEIGKSNESVRGDDLSSKSGRKEEDEESELESREGPFGGNIGSRGESGDVGYGRHSGQSGAM